MAGVNKAILIGNLGRDPDLRYTQTGQAVANFSVATNESWTDKEGEKQERTEFHRIVVWGKSAEACGQYLFKGSSVYVEGRIGYKDWEDKEGVTRQQTEIVATTVQFLGSAKGKPKQDGPDEGDGPDYDQGAREPDHNPASSGYTDDVPF